MDLFLIGAADNCGGLLPIVRVIVALIKIFMIVIPVGLIIFGTIDLGKAVIASEEKEVKAAQSRLIKRIIYAALIFFVPLIVGVVMNVVAAGDEKDTSKTGNTASWQQCWNDANK